MLNLYCKRIEVFHNGEKVGGRGVPVMKEDSDDISEKEINLTWKNLNDIYREMGLLLPFNIWNQKRGRRISFFEVTFTNKNKRDIKEWKHNNINIQIKISYEKDTWTSAQKILNEFDAETAIRYFVERGLTIIK